MPYQAIITAEDVFKQLQDIQAILGALDQTRVYDMVTDAIASAQNEIENDTRIALWPRICKTWPLDTDVQGVNYDFQEEQYDLHRINGRTLGRFVLRQRPIISIQRMALEADNINLFFNIPYTGNSKWTRIEKQMGVVTIYPIAGFAGIMDFGGNISPEMWQTFFGGLGVNGVVPRVVSVDYTAGIQDAKATDDTNNRWAQLRWNVAKLAGLYVYENLPSIIPAGVSSDGVSLSFIPPVTRIQLTRNEIDTFKQRFQKQFAPARLTFA